MSKTNYLSNTREITPETPSGFFKQFVRENKAIHIFFKLSSSVILIDILSNCFIKKYQFSWQ